MRFLHRACGQNAVHGPEHMGHGSGLREVPVAQQDADAAAVLRAGIIGGFAQFGVGFLGGVQGRTKGLTGGGHTQITQQRLVMHIIKAGIGAGRQVDRFHTRQGDKAAFYPLKGIAALLQ